MTEKERREFAAERNLEEAISELEHEGYRMDHRAKKNGYLSRMNVEVIREDYEGRFGKGITLEIPGYHDFAYHPIVYMIKDGEY